MPAGPRRTFVCLSSQRWSDGMWTNKQHIMSRLAREHRVIYVEPGTRPLFDPAWNAHRAADGGWHARARRWLEPLEREADGVEILEFLAPRITDHLPHGNGLRVAAQFDWRVLALQSWLRQRALHDAIVWVYHPGYGAN